MSDMITRNVEDENFAHCVKLTIMCAEFIKGLKPGHKLDQNDLNMVSIPCEVALAFIKKHGPKPRFSIAAAASSEN
jgi:hypothetical protein